MDNQENLEFSEYSLPFRGKKFFIVRLKRQMLLDGELFIINYQLFYSYFNVKNYLKSILYYL